MRWIRKIYVNYVTESVFELSLLRRANGSRGIVQGGMSAGSNGNQPTTFRGEKADHQWGNLKI